MVIAVRIGGGHTSQATRGCAATEERAPMPRSLLRFTQDRLSAPQDDKSEIPALQNPRCRPEGRHYSLDPLLIEEGSWKVARAGEGSSGSHTSQTMRSMRQQTETLLRHRRYKKKRS